VFGVDVVSDENLVFQSLTNEMLDQGNPLSVAWEVDRLVQLIRIKFVFTSSDVASSV
jgi:hypothetical protein